MKFAVIRNNNSRIRDKAAEELIGTCLDHGHRLCDDPYDANFILNLTSSSDPLVFKRRSKSLILITIISGEELNGTLRSVCYTSLIKTFANMLICVKPEDKFYRGVSTYFTTPEAGFYDTAFDPEKIYELMMPIAGAHFASENSFSTDLPERYYSPSPVVRDLMRYGKVIDELGVLPAPFPLTELLSEDDMLHLYRIFGITGASYGNLSAKEDIPEFDPPVFWMTGRGVNKSNISKVGKDVLLVKGFNFTTGTALISQPEGYNPRARVSVDAVEHSLIYKTFPGVGAIIHLHAWIDGVLCTQQNHPCGTIELAEEVVDLLKRTDNPESTVVGLKNHGLTITGKNLDDIFERVTGKLKTEVPMFA